MANQQIKEILFIYFRFKNDYEKANKLKSLKRKIK